MHLPSVAGLITSSLRLFEVRITRNLGFKCSANVWSSHQFWLTRIQNSSYLIIFHSVLFMATHWVRHRETIFTRFLLPILGRQRILPQFFSAFYVQFISCLSRWRESRRSLSVCFVCPRARKCGINKTMWTLVSVKDFLYFLPLWCPAGSVIFETLCLIYGFSVSPLGYYFCHTFKTKMECHLSAGSRRYPSGLQNAANSQVSYALQLRRSYSTQSLLLLLPAQNHVAKTDQCCSSFKGPILFPISGLYFSS